MQYSGISKEELEVLINKKQQQLYRLIAERDAPKEQITHNAGNGQVGYYTIGTREGIEKEIIDLKEEISQLQNQLKSIKKINLDKEVNKVQNEIAKEEEQNSIKKEQQEEKKYEELKHKSDFQRVRNIYKNNTNFLERAILKFKGKGLKSESSYTKEELEYLIATYKGDTILQQKKQEQIEKRYSNLERAEKIEQSQIASFKKMVGSNNLSEYIETEEMSQGRRSR